MTVLSEEDLWRDTDTQTLRITLRIQVSLCILLNIIGLVCVAFSGSVNPQWVMPFYIISLLWVFHASRFAWRHSVLLANELVRREKGG